MNLKYLKQLIILLLAFALVLALSGCKDDDSDGDQNAATTVMVRFDINGGTGTTPAARTVNQGTGITLPSGSGILKSGFAFGGWNANAEGTGTNYAASSSFTPNSDITLYVKWNVVVEMYTVTFRINGGSGTTPSPLSVPAGESVTLHDGYGLSRTGYSFMGWNTAANGLGTNYEAGSLFTPADNIILYAKWVEGYNVTFNAANAACKGAVPASQLVHAGNSIILPGNENFSLPYSNFTGWNTGLNGTGINYNAGDSFTPMSAVTLYANWVSNNTGYDSLTGLGNKLDWLQVYAPSNAEYVIDVTADESIHPQPPLFNNNRSGVKITLRGSGGNRTVSLASNGNMFYVSSGGTLILENITLEGRDNNTDSLVVVGHDATLTMKNGSVISGNNSDKDGGGVYMGGTFNMEGGTITGNSGARGGGVYVARTFNMESGTISGNSSPRGGGVYVDLYGKFRMESGTISGNIASEYGGGVFVFNISSFSVTGYGDFRKNAGTITGYADDTVNGNVVKDNGAVLSSRGHAIYVGEAVKLRRETTAGTSIGDWLYCYRTDSGVFYYNAYGWEEN